MLIFDCVFYKQQAIQWNRNNNKKLLLAIYLNWQAEAIMHYTEKSQQVYVKSWGAADQQLRWRIFKNVNINHPLIIRKNKCHSLKEITRCPIFSLPQTMWCTLQTSRRSLSQCWRGGNIMLCRFFSSAGEVNPERKQSIIACWKLEFGAHVNLLVGQQARAVM